MSKKQGVKRDSKESNKKDSNKTSKSNTYETEQQRRAKEKETIENITRENIQKYLKKLEADSKKIQAVDKATVQSIEKIAQDLKKGEIMIPDIASPLPPKPIVVPKLTYQEQRELQNKTKRENMVKKIEYLYEQIRGDGQKIIKKQNGQLIEFKEILTKDEHQRRMREIMQQKQERQKRLEELQEEEERKHKEDIERQQIAREEEIKKHKEEKKLKIQQKIAKRKQMHQKFTQEEAKGQKECINLSNKPKLFEQMQEKYKTQVELPLLQQKKNRLKELRDFKRQFNIEAIKEHQKQYTIKSLQKSRQKHPSQVNWKYDPPAKTQRLAKLLQEEQADKLSKIQARKRRIQDMQQRQEQFKANLKKYRPKIDQAKKNEIEKRIIQEQNKREKLKTGAQADPRQLGKEYLQIVKKMKRSQSVKAAVSRQPALSERQSKKSQTSKSSARLQNHSQQYYQDVRRKKIEDIVNSEENTINEKYMLLKMEAHKIGERLKQKQDLIRVKGSQEDEQEAAQLMLSSIKAKMGIVNLLKKGDSGKV